MGIVIATAEKTILEILAQLLNSSEIPEMPSEIAGIPLKNIQAYPEHPGSTWIVTAEEKNGRGKFLLYAELISGRYTYAWMLQTNGTSTFSLGEMELFGKKIPELGFISFTFQHIVFADREVASVSRWNQEIEQVTHDPSLLFPEETMYHGVRIRGELVLGPKGISVNLFLGFGDDSAAFAPMLWSPGRLLEETDYRREQWYDLQYPVGPLTFRRIGLKYSRGKLYLMLDALLAISGVELDLEGLAVSTSIWEWTPDYHLSGMKLSYNISPMLISGGLLENSATGRYSGFAVMEAFGRSFSAIGSYSERGGVPSLFVYVRTNGDLGGPPYFYVESLGLGFGLNKRFLEPPIEDVAKLPLLKGKEIDDALEELEDSHRPWLRDEIGTNWLAVGLEFTTFKFIRSKVLLIGQFGKELELLLLGQSTLELPDANNRFVFIETVLKGNWRPSEGFVGITGKITDNSFLFSKDSTITGGYAAWFWYKEPYKGDFVISAGGYHPQFHKPDHYPSLSRISVNWPLGWGTIKGDSYFALTPSCVMGGGSLELSYGGGDIKAWLTAQADVLVKWKPFYFDASFRVNVGASVRLHHKWIGSYTLEVEFGADFQLWGQPTGGQVYLGYKHFGITIEFGDDRPSSTDTISENEFKAMLPGKEHFVRIQPSKGLLRELPNGEWIVQPEEFQFTVSTGIPLIHLQRANMTKEYVVPAISDEPGIQPMGVNKMDESVLSLTLDSTGDADPLNNFDLIKIQSGVPQALWGIGGSESPGSTLMQHIMGVTGVPLPPSDQPRASINLQQKYEMELMGTAYIAAIVPTQTRGIPRENNNSITLIKDSISQGQAPQERKHIIEALVHAGIYPDNHDDSMSRLAVHAPELFREPPMMLRTS
ncbi:DUF6603 domain-containing protein [Paenibacillus maysiensis]|uniref:DUF6603 domain-containing protein n=1 Tax=Paenibacillus maysiensis TaxID=1155954 RepID=UPI000471712B|nr:DUF6603 domain-containing protein [Paenibacillus maysiensis]